MQRILQCLPGNMDMGGIESFLMSLYRKLDREKYQFDFIVHKTGKIFLRMRYMILEERFTDYPIKENIRLRIKRNFCR